ncbi:MAG: response regulator transcription factor [Lachnospiraceae bacterium]|nr:response regulator transcription factor [Lachnospiraceae bacterium]
MYHIGICDDDPVFINYMKRLFGEGITFYEYLSGEEMLQDMQNREKYDLLILDIALPGMDGNQTAKEFRKRFPDTLLVFCSGVYMPTVESFETTPYRYWLKKYSEERMREEIDGVFRVIKKSRIMPYVQGKRGNDIVRISPNQIYYIAILNKGTVLYCGDSGEKFNSSLKLAELYEQLEQFGFEYAHNSYIVNLQHVAVVKQTELEFVNGEKLSVSRAKAKSFKQAFVKSLSQKYER